MADVGWICITNNQWLNITVDNWDILELGCLAMSCIYGVKLNKQITDDKVVTPMSGQYLKVEVDSTINLADTGIFIYSRMPKVPEDGTWVSRFEAIATPNDLDELNAFSSEPASSDSSTTLFRASMCEFYFRSRNECEAAWRDISQDIKLLTKALALRCEHLADPVTLIYNTIDPTITDDISKGYVSGDIWENVVSTSKWECTDNTSSSAVWEPL
jgi:hypothetical protein